MLSILGALTGFAGSALPVVVDMFKGAQDNKLKLEELKLRAELAKQGVQMDIKRYEMMGDDDEHARLLKHDTAMQEDQGFFAGVRKSVRPVITYLFFAIFAAVKISSLLVALESQDFNAAIQTVWDEETQAIFAAIISFWFGSRALEKARGRVK